MRNVAIVVVLVTLIVIGGCGGSSVIAHALSLIKLADVVLDIKDRVTPDEEEKLTVLLDGYVVRTDAPNSAGALEISRLPVGKFLVSLVSADRRNGWHGTVQIGSGGATTAVNPFSGPVISGTVSRQTETAGQVPVANAVVVAFEDGANRLANGQGPLRIGGLSQGGHMMAMTNDQGGYVLGPSKYGKWLVAVFQPGYYADAKAVEVVAGGDVGNTNLLLRPQANASKATLSGTVVADANGVPLFAALARADLSQSQPLAVQVSSETRVAVQSATGLTLPAGAWFSWHFFATTTSTAGSYSLSVPATTVRAWAYKYGYAGASRDLTPLAGSVVSSDYRLQAQ